LKTVTANGLRFAYFEEGTGPLVLLVHGFPDTAYTWNVIQPAIAAAGYRVVAPFTRGYSPTEIPADGAYDSDTLGRDLLALISALGEKRAIVVGHDWGAGAAYSAAFMGPDQVELLVALAIPHPGSLVPTPIKLWKGRHFFVLHSKSAVAMVRKNDFAHVDELVQRWSPKWKVPAGETSRVKAAFSEPGCLDAALGYYRAMGLRRPPSQRGKIKVPTVAFAGDADLLAQSEYDKAAPWFTGGYQVVKMPGGHFMHREHPERFTQELLAVLAAHKNRSDLAPES
jgi:pimeloyl-ACP methyl ester carboxylesterase